MVGLVQVPLKMIRTVAGAKISMIGAMTGANIIGRYKIVPLKMTNAMTGAMTGANINGMQGLQ